jgi:hypothetical protein
VAPYRFKVFSISFRDRSELTSVCAAYFIS